MLLRSQAKLKNVKSLTFFRGKRRKKSRNLLKYVLKKKTFESMDIKPYRRKCKKKKINKLPKQGLLSELQNLKVPEPSTSPKVSKKQSTNKINKETVNEDKKEEKLLENEIISGPDAIETPFPSGGYFGNKSSKSETTTSLKDNLSLVSEKQDEEKCVNFPIPSGSACPSYLTMVKTAVRDLHPYKMTHREGIAKYIEIRYQVKDCKILKMVLKWMLVKGILKRRGCLYHFNKDIENCKPSSRRKSKIKKSKKRKMRNQHHQYKCHYLNEEFKKKLEQCCSDNSESDFEPHCSTKRKNSCKPKTRKRTKKCRPTQKRKKSKRRSSMRRKNKSCKTKLTGNRHPGCTRKRCDCYAALHKKRNRVKIGSRCIEKNGKYYMQNVYV